VLRTDTGRVISQMGSWTDLTNRGRRTMRAWIVSQALGSEFRDLARLSQCASPINSACESAISAVPQAPQSGQAHTAPPRSSG
jgi:hypothetical protein